MAGDTGVKEMTIEAIKEALDALEDLLYHDEEPDQRLGRAVYVLQEAVKEAEQGQWDAIPDAFNEWWNADYDDSTNPFRLNSPAYWAWSGWSAANKEKNK
jgi:hypothetical protein